MSIFATAGLQRLHWASQASAVPFVAADFDGQSWTEIGWLETIGEFGDESSEITFGRDCRARRTQS